jgi:hypothetical protein
MNDCAYLIRFISNMANSFDFAGYQGVVSEGGCGKNQRRVLFFVETTSTPSNPPVLTCAASGLVYLVTSSFASPYQDSFFDSLDLKAHPEPSSFLLFYSRHPHARHTQRYSRAMRPSFALPFALLSLLTSAAPPNKQNQKDHSTPYSRVLTGDTFKGATATGAWFVPPHSNRY